MILTESQIQDDGVKSTTITPKRIGKKESRRLEKRAQLLKRKLISSVSL
jgi:hypothetical protein